MILVLYVLISLVVCQLGSCLPQHKLSPSLLSLYKCDQLVQIPFNNSSQQKYHIKIPNIHPNQQAKKLCILIETPKDQHNKSVFQQIYNLCHTINNQIYYLRVDSMPNECIRIKNDIEFRLINIDSVNSSQARQSRQIYIAQVFVLKQCSKIQQNPHNSIDNHLQQSQSKTQLIQKVSLILQVRKVTTVLFGFPLYQAPFSHLLVIFLSLLVLFLLYQALIYQKTKQKFM